MKMSNYIDWFVKQMRERFSVIVEVTDISTESNELSHDEIDASLVPLKHLDILPNPVLFQLVSYQDEEQNEWIVCIAIEEETFNWLYVVWLKNGETVYYQFYV
jgi:hypothetical protein